MLICNHCYFVTNFARLNMNTYFSNFVHRMKFRFLLLTFLVLLFPGSYNTLSGQRFQNIKQAEDTLSAILAALNRASDDSTRNVMNLAFRENLFAALNLTSSDSYPFDSLKTLVKLTSPDNKFRFLHWNLPSPGGRNRYYGFLKLLNHEPALVYPLEDVSDSLPFPDTVQSGTRQWFGALYYKVIPVETKTGATVYTLLGWSGRTSTLTQKVIEVLSFDDGEVPRFGLKIFPDYKGGNMTRIIFRFAATTTMNLKYEKQTISGKKGWNSKKRTFDYSVTETPLILYDRMIPLDPQLEGQYQFYVPAGELSDGFIYNHHCWNSVSGIDSRNKKQ
jgi:hypothetical protein